MKKYRIRSGSVADYLRILFTSIVFWGIIGITTITTYGMF